MRRREFFAVAGGAITTFSAVALCGAAVHAQSRIFRVGMLWHAGNAEEEGAYFTALVRGFRSLETSRAATSFWRLAPALPRAITRLGHGHVEPRQAPQCRFGVTICN